MPLSADGCLVDQTPMSTQSTDIVQHAPPLYGQHVLDQLYADMDQTGFMTPAPQSGMNTPFYTQSRHGSSENLAALNGAAHPAGAVPPADLSNMLLNISRNRSFLGRHPGNGTGNTTPHHQPRESDGGYFGANAINGSNGNSGQQSNPLSRRTSEEDDHRATVSNMTSGQQTPEHIEHDFSDLGDLTKVPSYATAIKTPVRGMSYTDSVPNYSPPTAGGLSTPHVRSTSNGGTPNVERRNPLADFGFTPIHAPQAPPAAHTGDTDEGRRLHILQHRDRH